MQYRIRQAYITYGEINGKPAVKVEDNSIFEKGLLSKDWVEEEDMCSQMALYSQNITFDLSAHQKFRKELEYMLPGELREIQASETVEDDDIYDMQQTMYFVIESK